MSCAILGINARFFQPMSHAGFWRALAQGDSLAFGMSDARLTLQRTLPGPSWGAAPCGMFFDDIACFDRQLFSMSPPSLAFADPRQRLLLQATWRAIEDAGINCQQLHGKRVGVFVAHDGWYLDTYASGIVASADIQEFVVPGNDPCFLANRISSVFGFTGPSISLDTTCSGALVALHHAQQALANDECDYALVAAVTLFLRPWAEGESTATPFESSGLSMASFMGHADGYITSEGCGAILIARESVIPDTPVKAAQPYAHIIATATNSGGKTASFAQPCSEQQVKLIEGVLTTANLCADQVNYVEAHGVATSMGDAIEAQTLFAAFGNSQREIPCTVSCIKPNLGHTHAASGIYALLKTLLSMQYKKIAPIRGFDIDRLNPDIRPPEGVQFASDCINWQVTGSKRVALISSYGLSNVNAAIALKAIEAKQDSNKTQVRVRIKQPYLICISATSNAQLREYLLVLQQYVVSQTQRSKSKERVAFADFAYTLAHCRKSLMVRWTGQAKNWQQLDEQITHFLNLDSEAVAEFYSDEYLTVGDTQRDFPGKKRHTESTLIKKQIEEAVLQKNNAKLAMLWISGYDLPWQHLFPKGVKALRLPEYPFAQKSYWIPEKKSVVRQAAQRVPIPQQSDRYIAYTLKPSDFFLEDHKIQGQRILPAVMHIEMVRQSMVQLDAQCSTKILTLSDVTWQRPLLVGQYPVEAKVFLSVNDRQTHAFEVQSTDLSQQHAVHLYSAGLCRVDNEQPPVRHNLSQLQKEFKHGCLSGEHIYAVPEYLQLHLGPRLQGVERVFLGDKAVLAEIRLPSASVGDFGLHPAITDPILQVAFLALSMRYSPNIPLTIPFYLQQCTLFSATGAHMWAWIRYVKNSEPGDRVEKLDVDLIDNTGNVTMIMRGFSFRVLERLGQFVSDADEQVALAQPTVAMPAAVSVSKTALSDVEAIVQRCLCEQLGLPLSDIQRHTGFDTLGLDSILITRVTHTLEQHFGPLSKTLLFEHQSIGELAQHLLVVSGDKATNYQDISFRDVSENTHNQLTPNTARTPVNEPIAVVGLSGQYPGAENIDGLWEVLKNGRDCIEEVPVDRWDWRNYYDDKHQSDGYHHSRWGGFIHDIDKFDPLLFNIPPTEAPYIDPQERLILQNAWAALEDAGYSKSALTRTCAERAGVYIRVMYGQYQMLAAEFDAYGPSRRQGFAATLGSIANRVSYVFGFGGPSMVIDTQCSSSLTALHIACRDLREGDTDIALAGGINLTLHPAKYLELSRRKFISSEGQCQSFGEGGGGYIPSEGVGVAVLKRLSSALRDGDHCYGVIIGSAVNHGGKTSGYTVPNPKAQSCVIRKALAAANIDSTSVNYIEAHGTGTVLGDPIEVSALSAVFTCDTVKAEDQYLLGSIKSNIGHCESAAGIAGLSKVLLQLKHKKIAPSLHSNTLNPHIDFSQTPFKVNQRLCDWASIGVSTGEYTSPDIHDASLQCSPRTAGISSFGAGGANGHLLVQEYTPSRPVLPTQAYYVIPLSAATGEALLKRWQALQCFVEAQSFLHDQDCVEFMWALSCTLHLGREELAHRVGLLVSSYAELKQILSVEEVAQWREVEQVFIAQDSDSEALDTKGHLIPETAITEKVAQQDWPALLYTWVNNGPLNLIQLWADRPVRRLSMPTYPFAKERYWIADLRPQGQRSQEQAVPVRRGAQLHPLLHENQANLYGQRYRSVFSGNEAFLCEHQYHHAKVLPGAIVAHMFVVAAQHAAAIPVDETGRIRLSGLKWVHRATCGENGLDLSIEVSVSETKAPATASVTLTLLLKLLQYIEQEPPCLVAECIAEIAETAWQLDEIQDVPRPQTTQTHVAVSSHDLYKTFDRLGLCFGPTFRHIVDLSVTASGITAILADGQATSAVPEADFHWPDKLLDAAFQSTLCGHLQSENSVLDAINTLPLPTAVRAIRFASVIKPIDSIRCVMSDSPLSTNTHRLQRSYDLSLLAEDGSVQMQIDGFVNMPVKQTPVTPTVQDIATVFAQQHWLPWQPEGSVSTTDPAVDGLHYVLLVTEQAEVSSAILDHLRRHFSRAVFRDISLEAKQWMASYLYLIRPLQDLLQERDGNNVNRLQPLLIQLLLPNALSLQPLTAMHAMLQSIALEIPMLTVQTVSFTFASYDDSVKERLQQITNNRQSGQYRITDAGIKVLGNQRLTLEAVPSQRGWRDSGVYVLSGGAGGIGRLFANEILSHTLSAHVVLLGRRAMNVASTFPDKVQGRVHYYQVDICDESLLQQVLTGVRRDIGPLTGVMQLAGVTDDGHFLGKNIEQISNVVAPKVTGTVVLDRCTQDDVLDWFVVFSSLAGVMGNHGQADYALANAFLSQFTYQREQSVTEGVRCGQSRVIYWPLMADGGMGVSEAQRDAIAYQLGMQPMGPVQALQNWYRILDSQHTQVMLAQGDAERLSQWLGLSATKTEVEDLLDGAVEQLQIVLSEAFEAVLGIPKSRIDYYTPTQQLGFDSVTVVEIGNYLQQHFTSVPQVAFYEYPTIAKLAAHLASQHPTEANALLAQSDGISVGAQSQNDDPDEYQQIPDELDITARFLTPPSVLSDPTTTPLDIAVIGMSGLYPGAGDLQQLWQNLVDGVDATQRVPTDRWCLWEGQEAHHHAELWGGFVDGIDTFDNGLFDIDAREAASMDPQERKMLELVWAAIEDSGYRHPDLGFDGHRCCVGVYIGAMYGQYQLHGATGPYAFAGSQASIANRVSYYFDFTGPSLVVDSMCSSGSTAIEMACQALHQGVVTVAIAGGVNLASHPNKFTLLQQNGLLASTQSGQSFGSGSQGYVPGEGAGAFVLKRLEDAQADGDQIHGVILGCASAHTGQSNGYRVPEPNAQAHVIRSALKQARVSIDQLSYIEAHATGTHIGDAIEISALQKVASIASTQHRQDITLGSIKGNIGHGESVAAIAALTKVLLQFRHQQIPPVLYAKESLLVDTAASPFAINQQLMDWPASDAQPRVAGVSTFGAGGTNNHMIVCDMKSAPTANLKADRHETASCYYLPFSAESAEQLHVLLQRMRRYLQYCRQYKLAIDPADVAFTLQSGRLSFQHRVLLITENIESLYEQLDDIVQQKIAVSGALLLGVAPCRQMDERVLQEWANSTQKAQRAVLEWLNTTLSKWPTDALQQGYRLSLPSYPFAGHRSWWHHLGTLPEPVATRKNTSKPLFPNNCEENWPDDNHSAIFDGLCHVITQINGVLDTDALPLSANMRLTECSFDSIQIVRMCELWHLKYGTKLSQTWFFEAKNIADLVTLIAALGQHRERPDGVLIYHPTQAKEKSITSPLSDLQQAFIFGRRIKTYGKYVSSNIYLELKLADKVDVKKLQSSWDKLVRHHLMLHCVVDERYQLVWREPSPIAIDCQPRDQAACLQLRRQMIEQVFDVHQWPGVAIHISRLGEKKSLIHLVIDEIYGDAYSVLMLVQQWRALYRQHISTLPALDYDYFDHLKATERYQASDDYALSKAYWLNKLHDMPDGPRLQHTQVSDDSPAVHCLSDTLECAHWTAIKQFAKRQKVHVSAVLLAVFTQHLHRELKQQHFSINVTNLNRPPYHADVMQVVGLFASTHIFVSHGTASIKQAIAAAQQQLQEDAEHLGVSAITVRRAIRAQGDNNQADLSVVFTSLLSASLTGDVSSPDWAMHYIFNSTPQVCLDFQVIEVEGQIQLRWFIADSLYQNTQIHTLFRGYCAALRLLPEDLLNGETSIQTDIPKSLVMSDLQVAYAGARTGLLGTPGPSLVNLQLDFTGFDRSCFERAVNALIQAHPMLSATLTSDGRVIPQPSVQFLLPEIQQCADVQSFISCSDAMAIQASEQLFKLDQNRFFALQLCEWVGQITRVFLAIDLMVADGYSANLLCAQLLVCYHTDAATHLPTPAHYWPYHLQHQRGAETAHSVLGKTYWQQKFSELPSGPLQWLATMDAPGKNGQLSACLPGYAKLEQVATRCQVSLDALLCHAYMQTLIAAGQSLPFALVAVQWDRALQWEKADQLIGDFTRLAWVPAPLHNQSAIIGLRTLEQTMQLDLFHSASASGIAVLRQYRQLAFPVVYTGLLNTPQWQFEQKCAQPLPDTIQSTLMLSNTANVLLDCVCKRTSNDQLLVHWDTKLSNKGAMQQLFNDFLQRVTDLPAFDSALPGDISHINEHLPKPNHPAMEHKL